MSKRPEPEEIAQKVRAARKYAAISPELVSAVSAAETPKSKKEPEAVKRVKTKLHQMVGAYLESDMPFAEWLGQLAAATPAERPAVCRGILQSHASTRERLPEIGDFFAAAFAGLPPPETVVDLACGFNPLARCLMPLPATTTYVACDVHLEILAFVESALKLMSYPVVTSPLNLISDSPVPAADVVLLLKAIPCLEQMEKHVGTRLLARIEAPVIIVSYPTTALGGTRRGMARFYEERFLKIVPVDRFDIETYHFDSELMFRLFNRKARSHSRAPAS